MIPTRSPAIAQGTGRGAALLPAVLALAWLLNPSWGPSSQVLQACIAAAAGLAWLALRPQDGALAARLLAQGWLLAAVFSAVLGLVQYTGHWPATAWGLSGAPVGEIFGNLRQRNQFATLMAIGLCAAWYLALGAGRGARPWLAGAVVLVSIACGLTSSRIGALQWLLACCALMVLSLRGREGLPGWRWAVLALASYGFAVGWLPGLLAAWLDTPLTSLLSRLAQDVGCQSRRVLWANAVDLARLRPWFGWGVGEFDYAHYATLFDGPRFCSIVDNAHNLFLQVAVEWGLPALVALLAGMAWALWRARPWQEREPGRTLCWAVLAMVLLHSMVEYPLWYGPFQLALLLSVGHLWRTRALAHTPSAVAAPWFRATACGVGVLAVAAVAWDYHRVSQIFLPPAQRSSLYADDPLRHAWRSPLFRAQARFAAFTLTPLTAANAADMARMGERVLHYSPEPAVVRKLIEALLLSGQDEAAQWHLARLRAAFPAEYERFLHGRASTSS